MPLTRLRPTARHRTLALDAALAVAAFAVPALSLGGRGDVDSSAPQLEPGSYLLVALSSLPLVVWRRAPLAVFAVTAAASAWLNVLGFPPGPPIGATIALYLLALDPDRVRAPRWATAAVVIGLFGVHVATAGVGQDELPTVALLFGTIVWGGAWVLGDRVRMRRARIAELEQRARRAEVDAERERRLAAAEERTRIARDLHDSAGHAINVILVQAGAARLLAGRDPERSHAALETIEDVARETLGDIDRLVRALRDDDGAGRVEPPYGLAAVETLAERHRSAGLAVDVRTHGQRRQLAPAVDLAAYRILQEALTNAARHGGGRADVEIRFAPSSLELAVTNPARGAGIRPGHGIVGMRERAALLGGVITVRADGDRFRVEASIPYEGART